MSTICFLVKFFREAKHAADFVDGKVFCNRLCTFKKIEGSDDSGRADRNEGTTFWLQPGQANIVLNGRDLTEALAEPLQVQMDWLDDLHLFCMHAAHTGTLDVATLSNENIEVLRRELMVPDDCLKLGEHAVIVKDVADFVNRMSAAAKAKNYRFTRGLVEYYNPETFHGSFRGTESVFRKQRLHSYQREYRFVIDTGSLSDCPLTLEVGDLSDITISLRATELNGPQFLGGNLALGR